jgi:hypothetical protein
LGVRAGDPDAVGNQDLVDLLEFGGEQAIKGMFEANIVARPSALVSHACAWMKETP